MMKHTEKMILIPSEIGEHSRPIDILLNGLDSEMTKILNDKNVPAEVKLLKYNQVLSRFSRLQEKKRQPYKISMTKGKTGSITDEEILANIPQVPLKKAKMLLQHIHANRNIEIDHSGELIINGQKIHGSNIIDLVQDLARECKTITKMPGTKELLKALTRANVPAESIGNKQGKEIFTAARADIGFNWDERL